VVVLARSARFTTHERTETSSIPPGAGVYLPGAGNTLVENWLDLMLDPRPPHE
jgi:hypothetical protein